MRFFRRAMMFVIAVSTSVKLSFSNGGSNKISYANGGNDKVTLTNGG